MIKTVVITGSSRGIGLGLVHEYLKQGYKVIATCRNPSSAEELQKALAEASQPPAVQLDVENDESIFKAAAEVEKMVESVDILINNAGVASKNHPLDPATSIDRADALRVYSTNVLGPLKVTEAFLPLLRKGNEKKVINIGSLVGSISGVTSGQLMTYRMSKTALAMATKSQACEITEIAFLCLHPGWVQTDMGTVGGQKAPLAVDESVHATIATIGGFGPVDSGSFLDWNGSIIPY